MRRVVGVARKIAEHRAQICLLGLVEMQKYWRINNNILDLFFQYLDESIAKRLQGTDADTSHSQVVRNAAPSESDGADAVSSSGTEPPNFTPSDGIWIQPEIFENQHFMLFNELWDDGSIPGDLALFLEAGDPGQVESLNHF